MDSSISSIYKKKLWVDHDTVMTLLLAEVDSDLTCIWNSIFLVYIYMIRVLLLEVDILGNSLKTTIKGFNEAELS